MSKESDILEFERWIKKVSKQKRIKVGYMKIRKVIGVFIPVEGESVGSEIKCEVEERKS